MDNKKDFLEMLKKRTKEIEEHIYKYLPKEEGYQKTVIEAMNYSFLAGGKRLRPMLMEETFRLFGGEGDEIYAFMAAIEMIHTYSLIHDDLPAMDDDEYRRGRKTTHIVYGEDIGILAGDGLLNFAYEVMGTTFEKKESLSKTTKAFSYLAKCAGIYGMVGGQTVDVLSEKVGEMDLEKLNFIYELKTGALLQAAMVVGAILGEASEQEIMVIEQAALDMGIAFQIQDDILDIVSTTKELGKPVGSDEKNNKMTYVSYVGIEKAKEKVEELSHKAITEIKGLNRSNDFLLELIEKLINRKK